VVTAFIAVVVQLFFINRAWQLSGKKYIIALPLLALTIGALASMLGLTIKLSQQPTFERLAELKNFANGFGISAPICDFAITAVLIYFLRSFRQGFSRSDGIIRKLILFTLSTGLLTSLCAVCNVITLAVAPTKLTYGLFFGNLPKLYSNSLFALLNARDMIQERTPVTADGTSLSRHAVPDTRDR